MLIDTHAHLTDERFACDARVEDGLKRGMPDKVITVGWNEKSSEEAAAFARGHENVYCAIGVHPSDAVDYTDSCEKTLTELLRADKAVAVGETGLDYHYPDTDKKAQMKALEAQCALAQKLKLPVVFHVRDAMGDFIDFVRANKNAFSVGAQMHCFSGSLESAKLLLDCGFYISFAGTVTFKNAVNLQETAIYVPDDRLLTETDCPYLAPMPHRGQTNYPEYVALTNAFMATLRKTNSERIENIVYTNAKNLFKKIGD